MKKRYPVVQSGIRILIFVQSFGLNCPVPGTILKSNTV
jgi:hypothetical protein